MIISVNGYHLYHFKGYRLFRLSSALNFGGFAPPAAKASVAEKIDQVLAIDEVEAYSDSAEPVYNINGSLAKGNAQKGIVIKNGNKVLVK